MPKLFLMKYTKSIVLAAFLYGASSIQLNQMSAVSLADDEGADAEVAHEVEDGEAVEDEETADAEVEAEEEEDDESESDGESEEDAESESEGEEHQGLSQTEAESEELFAEPPHALSEQE